MTGRIRILGLVTALVALLLPLLPAAPAQAFSVACGEGYLGVDGNYVEGRANGHPSGEPEVLDGWGGLTAVDDLKIALFALERSGEVLDATIGIFDRGYDNPFTKLAQVGGVIAIAIIHVTTQSLQSVVLAHEQRNADVDECSGALIGELIDVLFITALEEDLAYLDLDGVDGGTSVPAPGSRAVAGAMFQLPQDGWPAWHGDGGHYDDLPGHTNSDIFYVDGALNGDYVGVAVTVRNQIAYLEASGISTGTTTTTTGPDGQQVTTYGARDLWQQAVQLMAQGDIRAAHTRFALAYQTAVSQASAPGATLPPPPPPPSPDPFYPW